MTTKDIIFNAYKCFFDFKFDRDIDYNDAKELLLHWEFCGKGSFCDFKGCNQLGQELKHFDECRNEKCSFCSPTRVLILAEKINKKRKLKKQNEKMQETMRYCAIQEEMKEQRKSNLEIMRPLKEELVSITPLAIEYLENGGVAFYNGKPISLKRKHTKKPITKEVVETVARKSRVDDLGSFMVDIEDRREINENIKISAVKKRKSKKTREE
jgi:hypothetical protein